MDPEAVVLDHFCATVSHKTAISIFKCGLIVIMVFCSSTKPTRSDQYHCWVNNSWRTTSRTKVGIFMSAYKWTWKCCLSWM